MTKHRSRYPKDTSGFGQHESDDKTILGNHLLVERNMFVVAEQFLRNLINEYESYPISSDGGRCVQDIASM